MATPVRLACVKPAASVRSEPGSNSQVGLETSNRLITTFDEVPPYLSPAIHIEDDDGVTFETCTAEVFRPASMRGNRSSHSSRLARTPPSTFLFLPLHLSNSPGPKDPASLTGSLAKHSPDDKSQPMTIGC